MKLIANINGKEYKVVQGATFAEDYNETLDSANIILSDEYRISSLKPYDDVLIYSTETPFNGVYQIGQDYLFFPSIEVSESELTGTWILIDYESSDRLTFLEQDSLNNCLFFGTWVETYADWFFNYQNNGMYPSRPSDSTYWFKPMNRFAFYADVELYDDGNVSTYQGVLFTFYGDSHYDEQDVHGANNTFYLYPNEPALINYPLIATYDPDTKQIVVNYKTSGENSDRTYWTINLSNIYVEADFIYPYKKQLSDKVFDISFPEYPSYLKTSLNHFEIKIYYYTYKFNNIGEFSSANDFNHAKSIYGALYYQAPGHTMREADSWTAGTVYFYRTSIYTSAKRTLESSALTTITPPLPQRPYSNLNIVASGTALGIYSSISLPQTVTFDFEKHGDNDYIEEYSSRAEKIEITAFDTIVVRQQTDLPHFYRHYLVDNFTANLLNLKTKKYKYKIALFSETKGLEKIVCPNLTITQPLDVTLRRSCWFYLQQYVRLYSPKVRIAIGNDKWIYKQKYILDPDLENIFGNIDCPEMAFTAPTLRELLSKIMSVKDCIPTVHDGTISCIDVSKRNGDFLADPEHINYIHESMSSAEYATVARREHEGALSQDHSTRCVEYLTFRNPSTALLTIEDLQLETRFPIYKINNITMCYYKEFDVYNKDPYKIITIPASEWETYPETHPNDTDYDPLTHTTYYWRYYGADGTKIMLVEQDMTKLVLQDTVRNAMAQDWEIYQSLPQNVDDMARFKVATVGYSIGSNKIQGWGTTYSYYPTRDFFGVEFASWFEVTRTYIENIFNLLDEIYPFGSALANSLIQGFAINVDDTYYKDKYTATRYDTASNSRAVNRMGNRLRNLVSPFSVDDASNYPVWTKFVAMLVGEYDRQDGYGKVTNVSSKLKGFFFKIDYNAMTSAAVEYTKDGNFEKEIMTTDNQSSALTVLEADGIFEKEKMNRIGNKTFYIQGRYDTYDQMNNLPTDTNPGFNNILGAVYKFDTDYPDSVQPDEDDVIIFHREYSIFDHEIKCNFLGMKDYVLRNYFTSVFAKYRTYNFMSYSESTNRAENIKQYIALSFDKLYYETTRKIANISTDFFMSSFESSINPGELENIDYPNKINIAYFVLPDTNEENRFASDVNCFASGGSLNFNFKTYDNVSNGIYIKDINTTGRLADGTQLKGSTQDWYLMPNSVSDPFVENFGCYISHYNAKAKFNKPFTHNYTTSEIDSLYNDILFKMPLLPSDAEISNVMGNVYNFSKDNKEVLDVTFQIEPLNFEPNDIKYSDWFFKLNDAVSTYNKWEKDEYIKSFGSFQDDTSNIYCYAYEEELTSLRTVSGAAIVLKIKPEYLEFGTYLQYTPQAIWTYYRKNNIEPILGRGQKSGFYGYIYRVNCYISRISENNDSDIILNVNKTIKYQEDTAPTIETGEMKESKSEDVLFSYLGTDGVYNYYQYKDSLTSNWQGAYEYQPVSCGENMTGSNNYLNLNSSNSIVEEAGIYIQTTIPLTYYKNFYVGFSSNKIDDNIIRKTYKSVAEINADGIELMPTATVSDVFYRYNNYTLRVDTTNAEAYPEDITSIHVWYREGDQEVEGDGVYHFVFGVNTNGAEQKDIYMSVLSQRGVNVYNQGGIKVGEITNYLDSDKTYGEDQYYEETEED